MNDNSGFTGRRRRRSGRPPDTSAEPPPLPWTPGRVTREQLHEAMGEARPCLDKDGQPLLRDDGEPVMAVVLDGTTIPFGAIADEAARLQKEAMQADREAKAPPKRSKQKATRGKQPKQPKPPSGPEITEDSAALDFAELHRDQLRFDHDAGVWFCWTGSHWRREGTGLALEWARQLVRRLSEDATGQGRYALGKTSFASGVERFARVDRAFAVTSDYWDRDPMLLGTPGGTVDLRTGALRASDPADGISKTTSVAPAATPDCPLFVAFLTKIMGEDAALIAYLQRAFGYCLTGDTSEQAIFFNHGGGQNGKTVLMSTVSGIVGDYCVATPIETFTESKNDRHPTELARMRGARLVTATETEAGRHWAESRLKELTGGERIPARFMRQDFFEFDPQFKGFISGNHRPRLRSVDVAMRRRVNMIPFLVTIPPAERDPQLTEKLKAERPSILRWMIDGCLAWQKRGLDPPKAVTKATDDYFAGEDGYADWIADRCEIIAGFWSPSSQLFASWRDYAEKAGMRAGDTKRFREEMERLGYPLKRTNTSNCYVGLRIRQDPPQPSDEDNPNVPW